MSLSSLLIIFSSSFMALFPVINPLGNGFVVNGFFANLDPSQRKTAIQKLTINFIMIGVGTLLIGHLFLLIFGLAIPVIQLGGGILICKTAIELLGDSNSSDKEGTSQNVDSFKWKSIEQKIFYPITFPISIGPGSISVIFTLMASASVKGKLLHTGINYLVIALVIRGKKRCVSKFGRSENI
jgi:membrane protein